MPAGRRDLKRPFHMLLAFHIRKVKIKLCLLGIKLSPCIYFGRHQAPFIIQKTNHFADMARSIYEFGREFATGERGFAYSHQGS